jgi:hypothetical protein
MTTIFIGNASRQEAERFALKIDGKSYMNFKVEICPIGGECAINVTTDYKASKREIQGMLNFIMFCELSK